MSVWRFLRDFRLPAVWLDEKLFKMTMLLTMMIKFKPALKMFQAICVNLPGGYECQCPKGYEMVENTCVDLDECDFSGDEAACHPTAECVNEIGSFHCTCPNDQVKQDDGSCIRESFGCHLGDTLV